jgi:Tfp pilus assembly protein PilN
MTSINLVTRDAEKPSSSLAREWLVCGVVIILLVLLYAGLLAYNQFLTQKAVGSVEEYGSQYSRLLESGKNVFDFQNRLEIARPLVSQENYAIESLSQIEKMIIPGVYVESFSWDSEKGKIELECVTGEYRLVANQLASLKKSDYFSEVVVNETKSREDGKISFFLELVIKNKK